MYGLCLVYVWFCSNFLAQTACAYDNLFWTWRTWGFEIVKICRRHLGLRFAEQVSIVDDNPGIIVKCFLFYVFMFDLITSAQCQWFWYLAYSSFGAVPHYESRQSITQCTVREQPTNVGAQNDAKQLEKYHPNCTAQCIKFYTASTPYRAYIWQLEGNIPEYEENVFAQNSSLPRPYFI
jgi:hypothetical protein